MRNLLLILIFTSTSFAFRLTSWVPTGSDRVNICCETIPEATRYDLYTCGSFLGTYTFANAVSAPGFSHQHYGNQAGREFLFVKALNAANEVIAISDTIGCYYLKNFFVEPGVPRMIKFGVGGLEYREMLGDSGCDFSDSVSTRPSDIIGSQIAAGSIGFAERVNRIDIGQFGYRNQNLVWSGGLETSGSGLMIPGLAYEFITPDAQHRPPILTGLARSDYLISKLIPISAPTPPATLATTPVSFPTIDVRPVSQLGLVSCGFVAGAIGYSDRIAEMYGGRFAYLTSSGNWAGGLVECAPEAAYNIVNKHGGPGWTYNTSLIGQP